MKRERRGKVHESIISPFPLPSSCSIGLFSHSRCPSERKGSRFCPVYGVNGGLNGWSLLEGGEAAD